MNRGDVLIVGAGPTGLVLALWLTKLGVKTRIVDKSVGPGTTSRALAVHARTLELYRQLDLADFIVAHGHETPAARFWVRGQSVASVSFMEISAGLTPFSSLLRILPQDEHEKLLVRRLAMLGVAVERRTELLGYEDDGDRVVARLRRSDGAEERCSAAYIAGCDGAHSLVRETMGVGYPGGDYRQLLYVADVEASGPAINGDLNLDLDEVDFLAVFPLSGEGRARLIGTVQDERAARPELLAFADVSQRIIVNLKVDVQKVNWFSTYHVHHRVAAHFRKGRAFLLGDSAHIHSPVGGQGMNTGIGDGINLAWKIEAVLAGRAPDALLDSYEAERIAFARRLVKTTDRAFTFINAEGKLADVIRARLAPHLIPALAKVEAWREFVFRTISQITIDYRRSPMSEGRAGQVHGGDRLPWVAAGGADNYRPLTAMTWQLHVYGAASAELAAWCEARRVPLHVYPWRAEYGEAGFARDALYLLRPDTYVAFAERSGSVDALSRFLDQRGIRIGPLRADGSGPAA